VSRQRCFCNKDEEYFEMDFEKGGERRCEHRPKPHFLKDPDSVENSRESRLMLFCSLFSAAFALISGSVFRRKQPVHCFGLESPLEDAF